MIYCIRSHLAVRRCLQMQVVTLLPDCASWGTASFLLPLMQMRKGKQKEMTASALPKQAVILFDT